MSGKMILSLRRMAALTVLLALLTVQTAALSACGESKSDDSALTGKLIDSYMESLRDYNFAGMNQCCMANIDSYTDCEEAVRACQSLAGRIEWRTENISIHGNSAIAQVELTLPADFGEICDLALGDLMKSIDAGSEGNPAELLASAIRKRAAKAESTQLSVEISMTKVGNRWYIVQSIGANRVLSDIRTPVAYAYSVIGM